MRMPKVSVIMPAYNNAGYIQEAVESVLAQTWPDWELIVVDDGSTDDTARVLRRFEGVIRYIYQENRGSAGARNTGIRASSGQFIAFLDGDDLWMPEFLAVQVQAFQEAPDMEVMYSWWCYIDEDGHQLPEQGVYRGKGQLLKEFALRNLFPVITALVPRQCINRVGLFDQSLRTREDWDFWLRMAQAGYRFGFSPRVLAKYRIHESNKLLNMDVQRQTAYQTALLEKFYSQQLPEEIAALRSRAYADVYLNSATLCYRTGDEQAAYEILREGVRVWPELLLQEDTYYRLICADQPPGYRDTRFFKDIERSARRLSHLLERIFADPAIARVVAPLEKTSRARAMFSLAKHYYLEGDGRAVQENLWGMAKTFPTALTESETWKLWGKSFLGPRRIAQLRQAGVLRRATD